MNRWKNAVIHLETAADSEHITVQFERMRQLREELRAGRINEEQFNQQSELRTRDIRSQGTALFLEHERRRYLITARHVLFDERTAVHELQQKQTRLASWSQQTSPTIWSHAQEDALSRISNIVFRVPSLDEVLVGSAGAHREFLMNLGAGAPSTVPYTFSQPEIDLAIVSLDQRDSRFAEELTQRGFAPVAMEDIADATPSEGTEVFAVGYPGAIALIGQMPLSRSEAHWTSSFFSLPTFAFGRISMQHPDLQFFWTDMSIYPGNSGGPVIAGDKLVGIVSAQPYIRVEHDSDASTPIPLRTRIPFGKIIKASHIRELLVRQRDKDQWKFGVSAPPQM